MDVKIGDLLQVVDIECNSFSLGENILVTETLTAYSFMCQGISRFTGKVITQLMVDDEVVHYTPSALPQTPQDFNVPVPKAVKIVDAGVCAEVSEEVEIAQKLGDIYGVWFEGQLVDVMDTREEAREVKFNLGGKARGAFIIQYGIIKEVR